MRFEDNRSSKATVKEADGNLEQLGVESRKEEVEGGGWRVK